MLITPRSSGIGRAVAILFAREGADVTIVHLPQEQKDADDTVKAVENEGRKALSIAFDLENFKQVDQVIKKHIDAFGRIDILVNNASKQTMEPDFTMIDLDSVESTFRSNIIQMFAITKFALPHMEKGASIINTTSVTTFKGSPAMVDYTSTKGAIVGFTRALAANLTPKGIVSHPLPSSPFSTIMITHMCLPTQRVNAVAPGPVHTPLQPASRPAEQMEGFGEHSVLGRPGQPSEIAPTYVFLASAESELYYGQIMHPYPLGDS